MDEQNIPFTETDVKEPTLLFRLLRKIVARVVAVAMRVTKLESAPQPLSIQRISQELQASGAAPLNITALPGVAKQPQLAGAPRLSSAPTGLVLQQYQDTQLLLVGTASTGYSLQAVQGGNPNSLITLVSGLSSSATIPTSTSLMTLDTVQTVTTGGIKTVNGSWTFGVNQTFSTNIAMTGGILNQYHGLNTAGEGIPYILARSALSSLSTQPASATVLYTATSSGEYRANYYVTVATTGVSGGCTMLFNWNDGIGLQGFLSAGSTFTTKNVVQGTVIVHLAAAQPIQYIPTIASSTGVPVGSVNVYVLLERLS